MARAVQVAVGLLILAAAGVYGVSERALGREYRIPSERLSLAFDPETADVERGRRLASVVAQCHHCHGPDLAGAPLADDPWIGRLWAGNLTSGRGGVGGRYAPADWVRAIRHGVGPDGRSLLLMPSAHLATISDEDLAALIAYLERVPPVDATPPPRRAGWLTRLAIATGRAPDLFSARDYEDARPARRRVRPEASADYGRYLVDLGSCRICHHDDLSGGLHPLSLPGEPPPPDLRPGGALAGWRLEDFARAMREGRLPSGEVLDRTFMPWPAFAGLSDLEIEAIWLYLGSLGDGDYETRVEVARASEPSGATGPND